MIRLFSKPLLVVAAVFFFCLFTSFTPTGPNLDVRLVGVWKGFEANKQIEGVEKHWIVQRFENGNYVIMFTTKEDCNIETFVEKGKWWTENGKFYEKSATSKANDVYTYTLENPLVVSFKSIELNGQKTDGYVFTDYKVELN